MVLFMGSSGLQICGVRIAGVNDSLGMPRHFATMDMRDRHPLPVLPTVPGTKEWTCLEARLELADAAHSVRLDDAAHWLNVACQVCPKSFS